jgi:DNA polymerase elongation subunit (family B)
MTSSKSSTAAHSCVRGWLLDVYPSDLGKIAVWVITEKGERIRFTDTFQPCIYVSGKQDDLERLLSRLFSNQKIASLRFVQKYAQVTDAEKSRVLEITVKDCRQIPSLSLEILRLGDYLRYEIHNCDVQNDRSYLFSRDLFPLAFVELKVTKSGLDYTLLDSVESTDYVIPKLQVIKLEVQVAQRGIIANFDDVIDKICLKQEGKEEIAIDYGDEATKLLQLVYAINELDPDIILTTAGDSYLFPYLIYRATVNNVLDNFILSRDNKPFNRKISAATPTFPMAAHFTGQAPCGYMEEYTSTKTTPSS